MVCRNYISTMTKLIKHEFICDLSYSHTTAHTHCMSIDKQRFAGCPDAGCPTRPPARTSAPCLNKVMLFRIVATTLETSLEVLIRFPSRAPLLDGHNLVITDDWFHKMQFKIHIQFASNSSFGTRSPCHDSYTSCLYISFCINGISVYTYHNVIAHYVRTLYPEPILGLISTGSPFIIFFHSARCTVYVYVCMYVCISTKSWSYIWW